MIQSYRTSIGFCDNTWCECRKLKNYQQEFMIRELDCNYPSNYRLKSKSTLFVNLGVHSTIFEVGSACVESKFGGFRIVDQSL